MRGHGVLGIVLAGGQGRRLWPLTADRAKPAVTFGGGYRLIDFTLSNLVNGGIRQICVLTQYKSYSLDRHIASAWALPGVLGQYIRTVPAQQRLGPRWYAGSADAISQSWHIIADADPEYVAVFSSDQVYRMDPGQMLRHHITSGAGVTIAAVRVPRAEATAFGCIESTGGGRITGFREKPADPPRLPGDPGSTLVSTGNYIFSTPVLAAAVGTDADAGVSDIGGDVIPRLVAQGLAGVYSLDADRAARGDRGYWRDIGTLDSYYQASLDLVSEDPAFSLHNDEWPIRAASPPVPSVKIVAGARPETSILGAGVVVAGCSVTESVLGTGVTVDHGAVVRGSVLLPGARVGKGAVVSRAIVDKYCVIEDGAQIGVDGDADRERHAVSPGGIVVLRKGTRVTEELP